MQMTAANIVYMKGEAAAQPGDSAVNALARAAEFGYLVPVGNRMPSSRASSHTALLTQQLKLRPVLGYRRRMLVSVDRRFCHHYARVIFANAVITDEC